MPMTVVVTRNVAERVRGFLASCMLEVAPGVYSSSNMNVSVREQVWGVLRKWEVGNQQDSAVILWQDSASPGGQNTEALGTPPVDLVRASGVVLSRRPLSEAALCSLTTEIDPVPF